MKPHSHAVAWCVVAGMACGLAAGADDAPQAGGFGAMVRAVTPPPPPPPAAEKGDVQLSGIYLQLTSLAIGGRIVFTDTHYYFMPDGHVFNGMPPGGTAHTPPTAEDLATLMKVDPRSFGTYKVAGDQITIRYVKGAKTETHKFALEKPGDTGVVLLDGTPAVRYGRFKEGQTLAGRYSGGSSVVTGGTAARGGGAELRAASSTTFDFRADGTFNEEGSSSFDVAGGANGGGRSAGRGKYRLSGNTLTLTYDDGKTQSFTVYPMPDKDESPPNRICVGGTFYTRG